MLYLNITEANSGFGDIGYREAHMKKLTLRKMGGSLGVTLPRELVERLQVSEGDELGVVETENGIMLTPYDPEFDRAMELYERGARKYRNALRELAQ